MKEQEGIQPLPYSGVDDLTCFLAWSHQIKLDMSKGNPSLFRVLGEVATSKHPIEGESFQTWSGASFSEGMSHHSFGADTKEEAKELREKEGRELGCLLVQRTQGETQLQVTKWLSATNGWEAWRQLNASFHFKLLASLLHTSFDESPASCLQQLSAWKEHVVLYQKLSGEHLSESVMLVSVLNGLQERARHFLLLHLDGDSSLSALENLLAIYFSMCVEQVSSLHIVATAEKEKQEEELGEHNRVDLQKNSLQQQQQEQDKLNQFVRGGKGNTPRTKGKRGAYTPQPPASKGKGEPNQLPNSARRACRDNPAAQELEHRGKRKAGRGEKKDKKQESGEAYPPQPQAYKGKGKQQQLPTRQWCSLCWKRGQSTRACWWNSNNQQHQEHQKQAWYQKKNQLPRDNGDQTFEQWLASTESLM